MSPVLAATLIAIGLAALDVMADGFIKKAGVGSTPDIKYFALGTILYASTVIGWYFVMKTLKLSSVGAIYGVSCVLFLTFAGIIFFGERLNTMEVLGIILAIASIIILSRFA